MRRLSRACGKKTRQKTVANLPDIPFFAYPGLNIHIFQKFHKLYIANMQILW